MILFFVLFFFCFLFLDRSKNISSSSTRLGVGHVERVLDGLPTPPLRSTFFFHCQKNAQMAIFFWNLRLTKGHLCNLNWRGKVDSAIAFEHDMNCSIKGGISLDMWICPPTLHIPSKNSTS